MVKKDLQDEERRGGVSLDTGLCMRNCVVDLVGSACTFSLPGLQPSASRSR